MKVFCENEHTILGHLSILLVHKDIWSKVGTAETFVASTGDFARKIVLFDSRCFFCVIRFQKSIKANASKIRKVDTHIVNDASAATGSKLGAVAHLKMDELPLILACPRDIYTRVGAFTTLHCIVQYSTNYKCYR